MYSSFIVAGDIALASHYNNLRKDIVNKDYGHTHDGSTWGGALVERGWHRVKLTDDYTTYSTSWTIRTGSRIYINIGARNSVLLRVRSYWNLYGSANPNAILYARISLNSQALTYSMGRMRDNNHGYISSFIGGTFLFTGLSTGWNTFDFEVKTAGLGGSEYFRNKCATLPEEHTFEMIGEEL